MDEEKVSGEPPPLHVHGFKTSWMLWCMAVSKLMNVKVALKRKAQRFFSTSKGLLWHGE